MTEKAYRSRCCKAEVRAGGIPDFLGSREVRTVSFICLKCGKPCDIILKEKREVSATKRRIQEQEGRLAFQGKILKKLVEFFDGITIHPVKGVVLTSKKKRQLAELKEMDWSGNIFKKRVKKPHK